MKEGLKSASGDTAVLLVSFGSLSLLDPQVGLGRLDHVIKCRVAPIPIFHAFLSDRMIGEIQLGGTRVFSPLEGIRALGYRRIVVQPLQLISGAEFDKVASLGLGLEGDVQVIVGRPLLGKGQGDLDDLVEALMPEMPKLEPGEGILWVGHGTSHRSHHTYLELAKHWQGHSDHIHLVTLEAPPRLEAILPILRDKYRRLYLMPLLMFSGKHLTRDVFEGDLSIMAKLLTAGIQVVPLAEGIASYKGVIEIFSKRIFEMVEEMGRKAMHKEMFSKDAIEIRPATVKDYKAILSLNEDLVHYLSPMDKVKLKHLHEQAELLWVALADGEVAAFLLALGQGKDYDSVNYTWFESRYDRFLYIDRVVVSTAHQGRGIGKKLYSTIRTYAKTLGYPVLTAEIDIEPPNLDSLEFHKAFGFSEVGRQSVADGKKVVSLQCLDLKV